ncbi:sulfite exporter TauE/SafE family protein [Paenibacillus doosanensis]|uniref:sulfite exporter TauE/SafE family protein n=1 Tax=Paenibacillus doosanensis TaxID=1229154 RepID=UPI00217FDB19|nr:sulfite exporter TauE/SafE family protein [Paenibacillus doosanensis]MCS7461211.1 sulfite exporter TauE/SafE family protein [Paenibacillus doosanensis]
MVINPEQWFLIFSAFFAIVFISNMIQGITGFAGAVIAMPFAVLLIGLETSKQVINVLGILASIWIVMKSYRHIIWNEFFKILITMLIGLIAGLLLYHVLPFKWLLIILPFFIMFVGFRGLYLQKKGGGSEKDIGKWSANILLLLAGVVHGLFVTGGPLLVIYATKRLKNKEEFRATLSMIWIVLNSIIAAESVWKGDFTPQFNHFLLLSILPLVIGTVIGSIFHKKMSQHLFMTISYTLLIISGASLLV